MQSTQGLSAEIRGEFLQVEAMGDKLPVMAGNALKLLRVNASATALEATVDTYLPLAGGTVTGNMSVNGNVGIGTAAPGAKLHVVGGLLASAFDANSTPVAFQAAGGMTIAYNGAGIGIIRAYSGSGGQAGAISFTNVAGAESVRIAATGNVTIAAPSSGVAVSASNAVGVSSVFSATSTGTAPDDTYNANYASTKPALSGQHISLVRSGTYVWSIGYVYNTTTFAIGRGQGTDSNFTAPAFQIAAAGNVTIAAPSGGVALTATAVAGALAANFPNGPTRVQSTTVAGLLAAGTAGSGAKAFVTDATVTTFASIVAGAGGNGVPVYSDGTNWRIG